MAFNTEFLDELDLPPSQISRAAGRRQLYATDYGTTEDEGVLPDAVVYPESTDDVSRVLAAANDHRVPVTPYAAGTSTEGHPIPVHGGISMDLMGLDQIIAIRPKDLQIDVEAGVIGSVIDEALRSHGLFFPPFPSSADMSTIGGMIANDASGMKTVKYGEVRDWVLELEVVLADGSIIRPGCRARKSSSGYNVKDLIVGSEGTLGVVTRATLELAGIPEQIWGGRAVFPSTDAAAAAVADVVASGVDVATIELMDPLSIRIANTYLDSGLDDVPVVFFEFHANHGIEEELAFCRSIFEMNGAERFEADSDPRAFDALWESRRQIGHALPAYDPNLDMLTVGDIAVPISAYSDVISFAHHVAEEYDLLIPCFGHGGDGNIHYTVLVNVDDEEHVARGWEASDRIVRRAIELGGTATGEHGIGSNKRRYMLEEHGSTEIALMDRLKSVFDPHGILNPGKVFPDNPTT